MSIVEDVEQLDRRWASDDAPVLVLPSRPSPHGEWARDAIARVPEVAGQALYGLLTSGSTGRPKLVVGSRSRSEDLTRTLHVVQDLEPVGSTVLLLPPTYSYAFVNQWLWARTHERPLVATEGFADPASLADSLRAAPSSMVCLVGSQVPLLERYYADTEFPEVVRVNFAGGRFPQERLDVVRSVFPRAQVFNNFGCAEALPRLTVRRAEDSDRPDDIGRPIDGVELAVDGDGALSFRSRYGAVGLVQDDAWRAIDPGEWVPTGDLGQELPSGQWRVLGRTGDVFKRHGEKVAVADVLGTTASAWSGQVAVLRDVDGAGEEGAVVVLSPRPEDADVRAILKAFRASHPRPQWPIRIESVATFAVLETGKIDVQGLRDSDEKVVHWWQRT